MRLSGISFRKQWHELLDLARNADADSVPDGQLVAPHLHQLEAHVEYHLRGDTIAEWRAESGRNVAAHPNAVAFGSAHDFSKRYERLADRHIDIALGETFRRRRKNSDCVGAGNPRALVALEVRNEHGVAYAGCFANAGEDLGRIGELRNRLGANERGCFNPFQTRLREQIDVADLIVG